MTDQAKQMNLCLFVAPAGHFNGAWRLPASQPERLHDVSYLAEIAQTAERAKLDAVFISDAGEKPGRQPPSTQLEPLMTLAALAPLTKRIGLVATVSTTFTEPYNLARYFATLDHLSSGRAGWNVVTSFQGGENFKGGLPDHEQRYEMAEEYLTLVTELWDSWEDAAVVNDKEGGYWARPERIHRLDFQGSFYRAAGPLNVSRCPQGWPVLFQAGASQTGMDFAARWAEAVFTIQPDVVAAQRFYSDVKGRVAATGRDPSRVKILPGMAAIVGDTAQEAVELSQHLSEMVDFEAGRGQLNDFLHMKLDDLELDEPFPHERWQAPATFDGNRSRYELLYRLAMDEGYTLRGLIKVRAASSGHPILKGTPGSIVDTMAKWVESGGCDGFTLEVPWLMGGLDSIADRIVPELQERGLFRGDYMGSTLRSHLGLERPAGRATTEVSSPVEYAMRSVSGESA